MNKLKATLVERYSNRTISSLVLSLEDCLLTAILIDSMHDKKEQEIGAAYWVMFKESETAIALLLPPAVVSIRNKLPCTVMAVKDDGILASVVMEYDGNRIESLITSESASELCLRPGKNVYALIKSTEIMIEKVLS